MDWASRAIGFILLCLAASQAHAATLSFPERGRSAVVDAASVIPGEAEAALEARLVAWNWSTGHQLVVATVPSLQGREIQDYGNHLLRHWRLGRAGADDGVILLLAPNERQVRIEVGYGLESVLTDALSGRIIREAILPPLRAGDVAGALTAGTERIMRAVETGGEARLQAEPRDAGRTLSWWWILFGILGCVIVGTFLYPLFELWFAVWPLYLLMPAGAKRAEHRHSARMAETKAGWRARHLVTATGARAEREGATGGRTNNLSTVRAMAESMRARLRKRRAQSRRASDRGGRDALEALRERAQGSYGSSSDDSSGGGSSDSGFDGGGGSSGGGGAGSGY